MANPQLGLSIHNFILISSLDAAFIIPSSGGFPDLPAGKAEDGTLKLAMDCEGLVLDKNGGFYISDEYGRNTPSYFLQSHLRSLHISLQQKRRTSRCYCSSRGAYSHA